MGEGDALPMSRGAGCTGEAVIAIEEAVHNWSKEEGLKL